VTHQNPYSGISREGRFWLLVTLAVVLLVVSVGGVWFYRNQETAARDDAARELTAIARLKTDQITEWRSGCLADAQRVTDAPSMTGFAMDWLADPRPETASVLMRTLNAVRNGDRYAEAIFVDVDGLVLMRTGEGTAPLHPMALAGLRAALETRAPVLTELHIRPDDPQPHLDVIAPLFAPDGSKTHPIGAAVLYDDARRFLYPLVETWPVPSESAETLLVERDGDDLLFLTNTKDGGDTALSLRIPLTDTDSAEVLAVLGEQDVVEGDDYRDNPVIAHAVPVKGSTWYLIAKIDTAEALADWHSRSALIIGILLTGMAIGVGGVTIAWQRISSSRLRELLAAERTARIAEERFRMLIEGAPDAIFIQSEGMFVYVNPAAVSLYGATDAGELIGSPVIERFHPDSRDLVRARMSAITHGTEPLEPADEIGLRLDGTTVDLSVAAVAIVYNDAPSGLVFARDVSARKRAENELRDLNEHLDALVSERTNELVMVNQRLDELNEALRATNSELEDASLAKTNFLGSMSHELRTPLNSVIGFTDVLLKELAGPLLPEQRKQLEMVNSSGHHLLSLVNDILDLVRIEAGRIDIEHVPVDLAELAGKICESMHPAALEKGLTATCAIAPGIEPIESDPRRIQQVLFNLLGNAIKFTENGSIQLGMSDSDDHVTITVTDTGCGIDPGDLENIFDEFYQGRNQDFSLTRGVGLGLPVSKKLVELLGGDISAESTPGVGSTFTVRLPKHPGDKPGPGF